MRQQWIQIQNEPNNNQSDRNLQSQVADAKLAVKKVIADAEKMEIDVVTLAVVHR